MNRRYDIFAQLVPVGAVVLIWSLLMLGCASEHRRATTTGVADVFGPRGNLVCRITLKDIERGGGVECLADSKFQSLTVQHVNQGRLGGSSTVVGSGFSQGTSSNAAQVVTSAGDVLADVVKAAITAAK